MVAFLAVTLVPACGLVWLGWALLEQDRALEIQRRRERRELAADSTTTALEQRLSSIERQLGVNMPLASVVQGNGAVAIEFGPRRIEVYPKERLAYYPSVTEGRTPPDQMFHGGEAFEFRQADYRKAESVYRELLRSADPIVRVGAQLRLARILRKTGKTEEALAAFEDLAQLKDVALDGTPSSLLARRTRCALLAELNKSESLRREAAQLLADLQRGRWRLTSAAYRIHMQDARGWTGTAAMPDSEPETLAEAVDALWQRWHSQLGQDSPSSGRLTNPSAEGRVTIVWIQNGERLRALAASDSYVSEHWLRPVSNSLARAGFSVRLHDGAERKSGGAVLNTLRTAQETGLPWGIVISTADSASESREFRGRRRLMLTGLVLIALLVVAGSYFIGRAVAREIAAARLQSEFVSAVSHEFRTPLTSLRQFTEILADKRVPEERRESYYQALSRATQRLHRLVEGLLDFGRMEAGVPVYRLAPIEVGEFVSATVEEFRGEMEGRGYTVEVRINDGGTVNADRELMTRALWNLLDNAVKYSPVNRTVFVGVGRAGEHIAIRVRDCGLGIAPEEQEEIFRKFVRGSSSKQVEANGTGIGLAMVQHITRAHGGSVRLESRHGEGSMFTILLPVRS